MEIKDCIVMLPEVLSVDACNQILGEYANAEDWQDANIGAHNNTDKTFRSSNIIHVSKVGVINKNLDTRKRLDALIFNAATVAIAEYTKRFPYCWVQEDTGYDLLRYKEGGFYREHVDHFKENSRAVSCSFALNDGYEGGEFSFFNGTIDHRIPKGAALMFPSNFLFPHAIKPVTSGTRYAIVTWFN
jgi:predicted 2-oxoglutarate/Fe(II)-dependent dioxygenase YbiX